MTKLNSKFAIIDIKSGRRAVEKKLDRGETVRLTLEVELSPVVWRDDGVSTEFECEVLKISDA